MTKQVRSKGKWWRYNLLDKDFTPSNTLNLRTNTSLGCLVRYLTRPRVAWTVIREKTTWQVDRTPFYKRIISEHTQILHPPGKLLVMLYTYFSVIVYSAFCDSSLWMLSETPESSVILSDGKSSMWAVNVNLRVIVKVSK